MVNNAGIQYTAPVQDFPVERWDAIIAINLSSAFHVDQCCASQDAATEIGDELSTAPALMAWWEVRSKSAYFAAKHGVVGLTKVVALETATTSITCNAICPGWVLTPLVQKQIDDRAVKEGILAARAKDDLLAEKQPSREFVTPEQLGALTVFLCSDAAAQVRGQALAMDGGWTAQ